jgi:hypothetical protein
MDLVRLRRRAVYIPTPGQTEQEYLGKYLAERRLAICVEQRGFSLQDALIKAQDLRVRPAVENGLLKNEIKILLERVSAPWAGGGRAQSAVADLG